MPGKLKKTVPLTKQIVRRLSDEILSGARPAGERLPSLREFAGLYQCSIAVINGAYNCLEEKGLIRRSHGAGTFVADDVRLEHKNFFHAWQAVFDMEPFRKFVERAAPELIINEFPSREYLGNRNYLEWLIQQNTGLAKHPGLIALDEGQLPILADCGVLEPLDELLYRSKILSPEKFPNSLLDAMRYNGKLYALPMNFCLPVLLYNKLRFRQAGRPFPDDHWGWNELLEHAAVLGNQELSLQSLGSLFTVSMYASFIFQSGGCFFDLNRNCAIARDEAAEGLMFFSRLMRQEGVVWHHYGDPRDILVKKLASGELAMVLGDSVDYTLLTRIAPPGEWGAQPVPRGSCRAAAVSLRGIGVTSNHPAPEKLLRNLELLFIRNHYADFCRECLALPAYDPVGLGVENFWLEWLKYARPPIQNPSLNVIPMVFETLNQALAQKRELDRSHLLEYQRMINAGL